MATRSYYDLLGISRNATDKEIRQAYRRLARKYHPDVNPGNASAEKRFKEIQQAYEVLSDPEKRTQYDRFGTSWEHARAGPGGFGAGQAEEFRFDPQEAGDAFDFGDIFERFFGSTARSRTAWDTARRPMRGEDIEHPVEVSLEEAYRGTQRVVEVSAADNGPSRRLEAKIPAGVRTGSRVRIASEGGAGIAGGPRGDLYLLVTVRPHPRFERRDDDLYCEIPLPLSKAVLGGEIEVPTLKGKVALKIPPETQNGRAFRLAGQGMPRLGGGGYGDLYAKVSIVLPTNLSSRQRELFVELQRLGS